MVAASRATAEEAQAARADAREASLTNRQALAFTWDLLRRHPWLLSAAVLLGALLAYVEWVILSFLLPFFRAAGLALPEGALGRSGVAFLADTFAGLTVVETIRFVAVALVVVHVVKGLLLYASGRVAGYMAAQVEQDLQARLFEQALSVDLAFIHRQRVGRLHNLLTAYPRDIARMSTKFLSAIPKAASLVSLVLFLVTLSPAMTLYALAVVAVGALGFGFIIGRVKTLARGINVSKEEQSQVSLETLQAMKLLRLFSREGHARRRFRRALQTLKRQQYRKGSLEALAAPLNALWTTGMTAIVLIGATFLLDRDDQGWGALLATLFLVMGRIAVPASGLLKRRMALAGSLPTFGRVVEFLDPKNKPIMRDGVRPFGRLQEAVRFENVSFRYDSAGPDILRRVTFEVPKGSTVAIVGGSGSGKSTLVNLVARLYDPTAGRVVVDGQDVRDLKAATWRRRLAVVSQDTFLFNASVRENIRYGRLDATDKEVEAAARLANAHEFIVRMERGYDTNVRDRAVRLSGGQAQRIALARAILAEPDLLILDEATSALDTATERQVQAAIDKVSKGRTVLVIAHRLSTIRHADLIVVLEKGRIVERGTHAELLAKGGKYARYVRLQELGQETNGNGAKRAGPRPKPALVVEVPAALRAKTGLPSPADDLDAAVDENADAPGDEGEPDAEPTPAARARVRRAP